MIEFTLVWLYDSVRSLYKKLVYYSRDIVNSLVLLATILLRGPTPLPDNVVIVEEHDPVWAVDMSTGDTGSLAIGGSVVPPEPLKDQKRPPCRADAEHLINGGCWVGTDRTPPCPAGFYASQAQCFIPVQSHRTPTSIIPK